MLRGINGSWWGDDGIIMPVPVAPIGVSVIEYLGWLKVLWEGVSWAEYYEVYRSDTQTGTFVKISVTNIIDELEYIDMSAVIGHSYWYKVRAVNAASGSTDGFSIATYGSNQAHPAAGPYSVMDGPELGFVALNDTFATIEADINGIVDDNIAEYADIAANKIAGTAVTQSEISAKTMNHAAFSKIPRHDQNSALWFPLGIKWAATSSPTYLKPDFTKGAYLLLSDAAAYAYINKAADGWHNGAAPSGTAATKMFMYFDVAKTLWVIEIDNIVCACVDPLNVAGIFVGPSVFSATRLAATGNAYITVTSSSVIEFYYNGTRVGYVDSTGTHEG